MAARLRLLLRPSRTGRPQPPLDLSLEEVCRKLALEYSVEKALLRRESPLGEPLELIECREAQDFAGLGRHLATLRLDWADLEFAALEKIGWNEELSGVRTAGNQPIRMG